MSRLVLPWIAHRARYFKNYILFPESYRTKHSSLRIIHWQVSLKSICTLNKLDTDYKLISKKLWDVRDGERFNASIMLITFSSAWNICSTLLFTMREEFHGIHGYYFVLAPLQQSITMIFRVVEKHQWLYVDNMSITSPANKFLLSICAFVAMLPYSISVINGELIFAANVRSWMFWKRAWHP